jgi:hypothetical protein
MEDELILQIKDGAKTVKITRHSKIFTLRIAANGYEYETLSGDIELMQLVKNALDNFLPPLKQNLTPR